MPGSGSALIALVAPATDAGSGLPSFSASAIWTEWGLAPFPTILTVWGVGFYLFGVWTLRSRGDSWAWGRTTAWVVGWLIFYFATSSGMAAYDTTLLSVHMAQHMLLSMLVPLALALGAPVTLALRTFPPSPRRWLLAVLHSRVAKVLSFPPLAFGLYVLSPWALYFSGWYEASLRSTYVHEMMHVHLVLVGALFFWPIVGVDPLPGKVAYPFRMLMLVMTLPFRVPRGHDHGPGGPAGRGLVPQLVRAVAARPGRGPARRRWAAVGLR